MISWAYLVIQISCTSFSLLFSLRSSLGFVSSDVAHKTAVAEGISLFGVNVWRGSFRTLVFSYRLQEKAMYLIVRDIDRSLDHTFSFSTCVLQQGKFRFSHVKVLRIGSMTYALSFLGLRASTRMFTLCFSKPEFNHFYADSIESSFRSWP